MELFGPGGQADCGSSPLVYARTAIALVQTYVSNIPFCCFPHAVLHTIVSGSSFLHAFQLATEKQMNTGRSLVSEATGVCLCTRPAVRRSPWLAQRLSRPQVIQPNAVSVVMATCVLQPTVLQQDKRGVSRQANHWKKARL